MTQLYNYLVTTDARLQMACEAYVKQDDRFALVLARLVPREPESPLGFDWVLLQSVEKAKYTHIVPEADMAIFSFPDCSVLVLFESGLLFAAPDSSPQNAACIVAWIESKGVVGKPQVIH